MKIVLKGFCILYNAEFLRRFKPRLVFSIIIPVYNTEKLLPRALDSILNQD